MQLLILHSTETELCNGINQFIMRHLVFLNDRHQSMRFEQK